MPRAGRIRDHGAIPERRHDAFLLALLLAVSLNIAFFVIQALIPKLAYLLQMLGAEPTVTAMQPEEEESYPFVLVDPSFLDEEPDPNVPTEAEANLTRQARQTEAHPDLPELSPTITEGIDEILTAPDGNPGPAISYQQSPGEEAQEQSRPDDAPSEHQDEAEPREQREPVEQTEPIEPMEQIEPTPSEEAPEPPPVPEPTEPPPTPEQPTPEPPQELPPVPEPVQEPEPAEPEPPLADPPPEEAVSETTEQPEPSPEDSPEPMSEIIDLASLPTSSEGLFDPEMQRLEELARRRREYPQPVPQSPRPNEFTQPAQPYQAPQVQQQPTEARPERTGRRQPTFKKIGGAAPSAASSAGAAPPRRRDNTAVRVLDADPSMALLAHRYGPYMEKLARQLQESLWRVMVLQPMDYTRGQVKVRFGISPDGTLTYYTTIYPEDGTMDRERSLSEQMLREAAPFDPLTPQMQADENFQRMTVIVNLY